MDIGFRIKKLKKTFSTGKMLQREYGDQISAKIQLRMKVLRIAKTLSDIPASPPYRCHQLLGKRKDQFTVDLSRQLRLVFVPNHDPIPRNPQGGICTKEITAITILGVIDVH